MNKNLLRIPVIDRILPEETLTSYFSHLAEINGLSLPTFRKAYLDKHYFPSRSGPLADIEAFTANNPSPVLPDAKELVMKHTTLPVFSMASSLSETGMNTAYLLHKSRYALILPKSLSLGETKPKYCPICAREDIRPFAHIPHQMPGVTVCAKHGCRLGEVITYNARTRGVTKEEIQYAQFMYDLYKNPLFIDRTTLYEHSIRNLSKKSNHAYGQLATAFLKNMTKTVIRSGLCCNDFLGLIKHASGNLQKHIFDYFHEKADGRYDFLSDEGYLVRLKCRICGAEFWCHPYAVIMGAGCPECFSHMAAQEQYQKMVSRFGAYEVLASDNQKNFRLKDMKTGEISGKLNETKLFWSDTVPTTSQFLEAHTSEKITAHNVNGFLTVSSPFGILSTSVPATKTNLEAYGKVFDWCEDTTSDYQDKRDPVGTIRKTGLGNSMMLIKRNDKDHVAVLLEDGKILPNKSYKALKNLPATGRTFGLMVHEYLDLHVKKHSDDDEKDIAAVLMGKRKVSNCGMMMTITECKSLSNITVEFDNGTTTSHKRYEDFLTGQIRPGGLSRKVKAKADAAKRQKARKSHLGEKTTTIDGLTAELVQWNSFHDIIAQTENGQKFQTSYTCFQKGMGIGAGLRKKDERAGKRIGETVTLHGGTTATITGYHGAKDVTVERSDGATFHIPYSDFKKGYRMGTRDKRCQERIGETVTLKNGMTATVTDYLGRGKVKVERSDGKTFCPTYADFQQGIGMGTVSNLRKDRIGETVTLANGMTATITEYLNADKVTVVRSDGEVFHTSYYYFKRGMGMEDKVSKSRIGETVTLPGGMTATITEYRNRCDLTVKRSDGKIFHPNYSDFKKGIGIGMEEKRRQDRVGETVTLPNGMTATIIEYKRLRKITAMRSDGEVYHLSYDNFRLGYGMGIRHKRNRGQCLEKQQAPDTDG